MRDYAIVSPRFWTGDTGRFLRKHPDAQRLALYLITCPSSNMLGLYYLPLPTICHELGLSEEGAREALRRASEGGYATFDEASETVFVPEMARFQIDEELKPTDNRVKAIEKALEQFRKSPFFNDFLDRYAVPFRLKTPRNPSPSEGAPKGLRRGFSQEQDQEQDFFDAEKPASRGKTPNGKTKAKTAGEKPKAPRPRNPLFDAIAEVCAADVGVPSVASHVGKICAELAAADPPYAPAEVREFGQSFRELCPWAAKDARQRPELGELAKHIGKVRAAKPGPAADPVDAAKLTRERIERLNVSAPPMFPEPAGGTR